MGAVSRTDGRCRGDWSFSPGWWDEFRVRSVAKSRERRRTRVLKRQSRALLYLQEESLVSLDARRGEVLLHSLRVTSSKLSLFICCKLLEVLRSHSLSLSVSLPRVISPTFCSPGRGSRICIQRWA